MSCIAYSTLKKICHWEGAKSAPKWRVGQKVEPNAVAMGLEDEGGAKAPKKTVQRKS